MSLSWAQNILCRQTYCYIILNYLRLFYGKPNPSILIGPFLAIQTVSMETVQATYFLFSKAGKFKTSIARVAYNKLLTNLASSSRTGECWPLVVFARASLRSVCIATTSGQYSPVRSSCSVSIFFVIAPHR